jgi:RHS repeat-associated protein
MDVRIWSIPGATTAQGRAYQYLPGLSSGGFGTTRPVPGQYATACDGQSCIPANDLSLFADFDGDLSPDFVRLEADAGQGQIRVGHANNATRFRARDVIEGITTGYGATTFIQYLPTSVRDVYRPDRGSRSDNDPHTPGTQVYGRKSPVQDLRGHAYVVSTVQSDAPTHADDDDYSYMVYRYGGAKIQSGGRGMLGYRQIQSIEANHGSAHVISTTLYHQDFPLIGMPAISDKRYRAGAFAQDACRASPWSNTCFGAETGPGGLPDPGGNQISRTLHYWHAAPGLTGSSGTYTAVPRFVGTFLAREVTYDAFSGACKPITNTTTANVKLQDEAIVASYDTWGNATQTVTDVTVGTDIVGEPGVCGAMPQAPLRADSAPVMARVPEGSSGFESCTGGCVQRKITENVFSNFTGSAWLLGRMTSSEVTSLRSGVAAAAKRISHFTYATSGAATGFLTVEHLQKAISPNQDLRTEYVLDTFGNRVGIYTCSGELTGVQCRNPTAVVHRPEAADGGPDARVHRYERHIFDPRGRFLLEVRRPYFDPNAGANQVEEHAQQTITERSAYGEVTAESLVSGLTRRAAFGHLGRPYASEDDTGAQQVVTFRWCQGQGPAPTVACPPRAVFRQQTVTAGAPRAWTYFDRLGRELLKAAENFNDPADNAGFVLKQFSASCQFFDHWGRLERASEPFFLPQAPVSGAPSFTTDDLCASPPVEFTRTQHDVLGRPTNVFLPGSGRTESMSYSGLKTTVTNPAEQKTTTTKNALGEVIEVRDSGISGQGNDGLVTYYRFDAFSNLIEVRRNSGALDRHDVVSTMLYDALGRKRSDSDPDAGSAQYVYNAAGEIIRQIDGKGQVIEQYYDALGRVWKRRIYSSDRIFADGAYRLGEAAPPAPGSLATATIDLTEYDTAANGVGAIASRERSAHLEPVWRETFSYDSRGRPQRRDLLVGGQSFFEQTVFDALGRVFRQRDASGAWTKQIWSPRGFVRRLCASAAGDSDAVSCSGRVFHELIEQTARGQAKIDRRNGSDTLRTTRTYDDSTGWLEAIQSGSANAIQNLHYTRDALGQLLSREDQRRDLRETFAYDGLNRLTLVQLSLNGQSAIDALLLSYDRLGNICSKKEFLGAVQSYVYAGAAGCVGAGNAIGISPHAVTSAHGRLYTYDRNGNQTRAQTGSASLSRTVAYTAEDQVSEIVQGTRTTRFTYGPDGSRWRREDIGDPGGNRTTLYLGGVERISQSGTQTWRRHVGGVAVVNLTGATETVRWLFQDHLGSIDAVTHDNGVLAAGESMSFDAHGRRRDVEDWRDQPPNNPQQTTRGFTGHEQIDAHELVHMNGRVYDPLLGRFIQADPIVQDPYAPQNWNRYTYVYNNPLNGTDPSGYSSIGTWIATIAVIALSFATGYAAGVLLEAGKVGAAALTVAWGGALAGAVSGGGASGAAKGAFSALAFFGIGSYFQSSHATGMGLRNAHGLTTSGRIVKVLAHGVTSGVMHDLQGGKFGHGFASGAFNEAVSPWIDHVPKIAGQIAVSALVGGTATKLAGGKFANGAMSGAFARAFASILRNQPQGSASQRELTFETVSGPDYFQDGGWNWRIKWGLSMPSNDGGWIVQEVRYNLDAMGVDGAALSESAHYWEAWRVEPGDTTTSGPLWWDDQFSADVQGKAVSINFSTVASARFYEGLQLPKLFRAHSVASAGALRATTVDPHLPVTSATAPVVRTFEHRWPQ